MKQVVPFAIFAAWCVVLWQILDFAGNPAPSAQSVDNKTVTVDWNTFFARNLSHALPIANRFDFPVKAPDGAGAFIGKPFGGTAGGHAGEDWNTALGNTDLGEPITSPADGWVSLAMDFQSAWGKVVLVIYRLEPGEQPPAVEMMFAHLSEIDVQPLSFVKRGQLLGKMGNADGVYLAHLHWEVRRVLGLGLGGAYADDLKPWFAPSEFVSAHRGSEKASSKAKNLPAALWDKWGGD